MTQQPFSRPGAIDLSALKRPPAGAPAPAAAGGAPGAGGSAYSVVLDEQNFQATLESSITAPVLLVFYSPTRHPASAQLAEDMKTLSDEFEGRFLLGLVDIDAVPQIAQAMQIPSVPLVVAVLDGRPMPLFQDALPLEELRTALTQVVQQLTAQGVTTRHQPRTAAPGAGRRGRRAARRPAVRAGPGRARGRRHRRRGRGVPEADRRQPRRRGGRRRPGDGQGAPAHRRGRPGRRARPRPRRLPTTSPRRPWSPTSTCSAATSTTRSTGSSSWYAAPRAPSATRPASTCSACSRRSATRTPGCSRVGSGWRPRCSSRRGLEARCARSSTTGAARLELADCDHRGSVAADGRAAGLQPGDGHPER